MSMRVGANVLHFPHDQANLSDHFPVFASIQDDANVPYSCFPRRIPDWIFRDPVWAKTVDSLAADRRILGTSDPWLGLHLVKEIFHEAAARISFSTTSACPKSTQFRLGKVMGALKAIRTKDKKSFDKCCRSYPDIRLKAQRNETMGSDCWPLSPSALDRLRDHAATLAQEELREQIELEVRSTDDWQDFTPRSSAKRNRVNVLLEVYRCWRRRRTTSAIAAVVKSDGIVTSDPTEMAEELSKHWQGVFSKAPPAQHPIETFMKENMPPFPPIDWHVTEDDFLAVLQQSGNTAPGPDGIPYGCWRKAPRWVQSLLYTCCNTWLGGSRLPLNFNWSFLTLLPKVDTGELRSKDTRPLSLGNSDAKLFASALQSRFELGLEHFVSTEQSGFMRGRSIIGAIVETESTMITHSLSHDRAAALFFDFSAAFPSLAHPFIWEGLKAAGIPHTVIDAIKQLYDNNAHWLKLKGGLYPSIVVRSGVKQGCPLSPTLFIVACEAVLRFLKKNLDPRSDHLSGYADDLAVILGNLWKSAPALALAFSRVADVSGLELNVSKCVLIPLWVRAGGPLRHLEELVPAWRHFKISLSVKYLGAMIGPDSHQFRWESADRKFHDRLQSISKLGGGHFFTTLFFRIYAATVFSHLMQIFEPRDWQELQSKAIRQLVKGPKDWLPISWATAPVSGTPPPCQFQDLHVLHEAILMRCATQTFPRCSEVHNRIRAVLDADTAPLWHPWQSWHQHSSATTLAEAAARGKGILHAFPRDEQHLVQSHLYKHLQGQRAKISPWPTWERRLQRWAALSSPAPFLRVLCSRITRVLLSTSSAPVSTRWALLRTYLNGWCTARRFQRTGACLFCKGGEDSLEHFSRCPIIRVVANSRMDLNLCASRPLRFFMLDGDVLSRDQILRHAVFLHAVYRAHNHLRWHPVSGSTQDRIWSEVRSVCMSHPGLIRVIPT